MFRSLPMVFTKAEKARDMKSEGPLLDYRQASCYHCCSGGQSDGVATTLCISHVLPPLHGRKPLRKVSWFLSKAKVSQYWYIFFVVIAYHLTSPTISKLMLCIGDRS